MREVKIVIDGKEYAKTNPMVADWKNLMACQKKSKGKNLVLDVDGGPMQNIIALVADYVLAPVEKIESQCPVDMIMSAYYAIDENIAEAFTRETTEKNAEGVKAPKK